jgi:hypothetical protein
MFVLREYGRWKSEVLDLLLYLPRYSIAFYLPALGAKLGTASG